MFYCQAMKDKFENRQATLKEKYLQNRNPAKGFRVHYTQINRIWLMI